MKWEWGVGSRGYGVGTMKWEWGVDNVKWEWGVGSRE